MRISMENHVLRRMKESEQMQEQMQVQGLQMKNTGVEMQVLQEVMVQKTEFLIWWRTIQQVPQQQGWQERAVIQRQLRISRLRISRLILHSA